MGGETNGPKTLCLRSRAGGYHYLGNKDRTAFNAPIFIQAKVIKNVMASAAEAGGVPT
jgi:hypothetical protein